MSKRSLLHDLFLAKGRIKMSKQPHYFTEKRSVEGKIGIWASPTSKYEREADSNHVD